MTITKKQTPVEQADIDLKNHLKKNGYYNIRILPDGMVCNIDFIFTTAIIINPNYSSYEKRYCYAKRDIAKKAILKIKSVEDFLNNPEPGYTAIK